MSPSAWGLRRFLPPWVHVWFEECWVLRFWPRPSTSATQAHGDANESMDGRMGTGHVPLCVPLCQLRVWLGEQVVGGAASNGAIESVVDSYEHEASYKLLQAKPSTNEFLSHTVSLSKGQWIVEISQHFSRSLITRSLLYKRPLIRDNIGD